MQTLQIYEAGDGTRFDDAKLCERYEAQCAIIEQAMKLLKPLPKESTCNFRNGGGFIQQSKDAVLMAYGMVLDIAKDLVGPIGAQTIDRICAAYEFAPKSIIGRYLDDSGHRAIYRAWNRFMNMDKQWREWGQGYFATHPSEGKQVELAA